MRTWRPSGSSAGKALDFCVLSFFKKKEEAEAIQKCEELNTGIELESKIYWRLVLLLRVLVVLFEAESPEIKVFISMKTQSFSIEFKIQEIWGQFCAAQLVLVLNNNLFKRNCFGFVAKSFASRWLGAIFQLEIFENFEDLKDIIEKAVPNFCNKSKGAKSSLWWGFYSKTAWLFGNEVCRRNFSKVKKSVIIPNKFGNWKL